jgi:hypothetical protein
MLVGACGADEAGRCWSTIASSRMRSGSAWRPLPGSRSMKSRRSACVRKRVSTLRMPDGARSPAIQRRNVRSRTESVRSSPTWSTRSIMRSTSGDARRLARDAQNRPRSGEPGRSISLANYLLRRPRHRHCTTTQQLFIHAATEFFDFLGRLAPPVVRSHSLSARIAAYKRLMLEERGPPAVTVDARCKHVGRFLASLRRRPRSSDRLPCTQIDRYVVSQSCDGWGRSSMAVLASSLRCFFRFAEAHHWCQCQSDTATAIDSPRMYRHEAIPRVRAGMIVDAIVKNLLGSTIHSRTP